MRYILSNIKYYVPTLAQSLLLVLIFLIVGNLGTALLVNIINLFWAVEFPHCVIYLLSMLPVFVWVIVKGRFQRVFVGEFLEVNKPSLGGMNPFIFPLLIIFVTLGISYIIEPLYSWIPMPENIQKLFELSFMDGGKIDLFITASILAPLCEEFMCRGVILRGLLYHKTPIKAILISALIFAVIHMNPWQAIPAFIVGCFMGWIYYRTHSFWACVFIHFTNNTMTQVWQWIFPNTAVTDTFYTVMPHTLYFIIYVVALIVVATIVYYFNKNMPKASTEKWQVE